MEPELSLLFFFAFCCVLSASVMVVFCFLSVNLEPGSSSHGCQFHLLVRVMFMGSMGMGLFVCRVLHGYLRYLLCKCTEHVSHVKLGTLGLGGCCLMG